MRSPDVVGAVVLLVALASCAASTPRAPGPPDPVDLDALAATLDTAPPPAGTLRVRLAFPEGADLDLFVTDPAQESVYFANSPSRSGGRLERDVRCGDPGPRIETVVFPAAAPGRYRIGVDHPRRCEPAPGGPAPFVVVVDGHGPPETRRGAVGLEVFLPMVLEVDVAPASG